MTNLSVPQIIEHAARLRKAGITMSNYDDVFDACLVLIRELARNIEDDRCERNRAMSMSKPAPKPEATD